MFLFVRLDNLPKLHDVTINTTSEAGGIIPNKNGGRKYEKDEESVVSIHMVFMLVALKLKIIQLYLRI
jgi:hypothetical protein